MSQIHQTHYEYFGHSFEHRQSYRNVIYHFGIDIHRAPKCSIPNLAPYCCNRDCDVLYSIVWYSTVYQWSTPAVEESSGPCVGTQSLGTLLLTVGSLAWLKENFHSPHSPINQVPDQRHTHRQKFDSVNRPSRLVWCLLKMVAHKNFVAISTNKSMHK